MTIFNKKTSRSAVWALVASMGCAAGPVRVGEAEAPLVGVHGPVMRAKRPPPRGPDAPITAAQRAQAIEALLRVLHEKYVFPEKAKQAQAEIRARVKRGEYAAANTGHTFAALLTDHVNAVLQDAHFGVNFSADKLPAREAIEELSAAEIAELKAAERNLNGGFERVERLPGNIGYVEVRSFMFAGRGYDAATAAMAFVAETDALIVDLRRNGGGDPDMVAALASWFFDESVHLNDLYFRPADVTRQYWTLPGVPGRRYVGRDVFVLVGPRTGSGAEEFAYDLQQLKRATIVGEVTWGGANPGESVRLGDHFDAFVPNGRAINPVTKTNWEGVGVQPDVATPADDALRVAQVKLLERRLAAVTDPALRRGLEERMKELAEAP